MKKLNQTKPIIYFKANRKLDILLARPGNIFQPLQNPPTIQEEPIIRTQAAISPEHVLRTESDVSFEPGFIFEYNLPHSFQQNLPEDLSEASNTSPVALELTTVEVEPISLPNSADSNSSSRKTNLQINTPVVPREPQNPCTSNSIVKSSTDSTTFKNSTVNIDNFKSYFNELFNKLIPLQFHGLRIPEIKNKFECKASYQRLEGKNLYYDDFKNFTQKYLPGILKKWVYAKHLSSNFPSEAERLKATEKEFKEMLNKTLSNRRALKSKQKLKVINNFLYCLRTFNQISNLKRETLTQRASWHLMMMSSLILREILKFE